MTCCNVNLPEQILDKYYFIRCEIKKEKHTINYSYVIVILRKTLQEATIAK